MRTSGPDPTEPVTCHQRRCPVNAAELERPRWIDAYITSSGLPDPRLVGTTAKPRHCDCGALTLVGYDAPLCANLSVVDPYQATPQFEAAAVILAIPTYQLWGHPGRYDLTNRHRPGIPPICQRKPATECVVVIGHRCGHPPLATIPLATRHSQFTHPTNPPF